MVLTSQRPLQGQIMSWRLSDALKTFASGAEQFDDVTMLAVKMICERYLKNFR